MRTIKVKLNAPLGGFPAGKVMNLDVDNKGVPLDRGWRDRLKDSKIDNCLELVGENKSERKVKSNKEDEK